MAAVIAVILIVLVAAFLVVYENHQVPINANEAVIYYSMSSPSFFYNTTGTENYIIVYCANSGKSIGDFDLTIKFVNATFSTTTGQPYTKINAASAEFNFDLNAGNISASKDVYFSINPDVNSFSITLSIHSNQASLKTVAEVP